MIDPIRQEQDRIQKRISQMYDDKLDGLIDEEGLFVNSLKITKNDKASLEINWLGMKLLIYNSI